MIHARVSDSSKPKRLGFAANTLWTWTSLIIAFTTALVVSPMMIKRLGAEAYGLWTIAFGVTEYYSIADLGVRSAVLKYVAHHWALGETGALNRTLNTAFVFFGAGGLLILVATIIIAPLGPRFFVVSPEMASMFVFVMTAIGSTFALVFAMSWLNAVLESVQRFDLSYRIIIASNVVRVSGTVVVLLAGLGLPAVVIVTVVARMLQCLLVYRAFRSFFADWRWSLAGVNPQTFKQLFRFSVFTLPSNVSQIFIEHGPAVVIGHYLPAAYVGYYMLPRRLVQIGLELVHGIGSVATARAAELGAKDDREGLLRLGIFTNRYGLLSVVPSTVFLFLYGTGVFALWLTPEFAARSGPVLMVFAIAFMLGDASQFSSSAMLFGLARHQVYSFTLVAEAVVTFALVFAFAAAGNLLAAAIGASIATVINRGFVTPYLLCRYLKHPVSRYIAAIVTRPLIVGVVAGGLMWISKTTWLPGTTYLGIGVAMVLTGSICALLGGRLCILPDHYGWIVATVRERAPWFEQPVRTWLGISRSAA